MTGHGQKFVIGTQKQEELQNIIQKYLFRLINPERIKAVLPNRIQIVF